MKLLNKSSQIFQRDHKGRLLPERVIVVDAPLPGTWEVWMTPFNIGELNEFNASEAFGTSSSEFESVSVQKHFYIDGSTLSKVEVELLLPPWAESLMKTLLYYSGIGLNNLGIDSEPSQFKKKELTEFQKNVTSKIKAKSGQSKLIDFLHERGIDFFQIPQLCRFEIDQLIEGFTERTG